MLKQLFAGAFAIGALLGFASTAKANVAYCAGATGIPALGDSNNLHTGKFVNSASTNSQTGEFCNAGANAGFYVNEYNNAGQLIKQTKFALPGSFNASYFSPMVGDFDDDGLDDVFVWEWVPGTPNQPIKVWYLQGANAGTVQTLFATDQTTRRLVGMARFGPIGTKDLVIEFSDAALKYMGYQRYTGQTITGGGYIQNVPYNLNYNQNWYATGLGDYNGDGKTDIFFVGQGINGAGTKTPAIWLMDGTDKLLGTGVLPTVPSNFVFAGLAKFTNGNSNSLYLLQPTGPTQFGYWYTNPANYGIVTSNWFSNPNGI